MPGLIDAENSETQLGKDVKYKMLVRALDMSTEEELAQHVSEGFTVSFWSSDLAFFPVLCPVIFLTFTVML